VLASEETVGLRSKLKNRIKRTLGVHEPQPEAAAPINTPSAAPSAPSAVNAAAGTGPTDDGFYAVVASDKLTEGNHGTYRAGDHIIVVFREAGALYAVDNTCNHEDGPVGEGERTGTVIACPYHDWRYDFTNGACLTHPGRDLATYGVREQDGLIWVGGRITAGADLHDRGGEHNDGMEFADNQGRPADWNGRD
jgi:nitrite reductase/ring-hydroxylating ferredoxin subunit